MLSLNSIPLRLRLIPEADGTWEIKSVAESAGELNTRKPEANRVQVHTQGIRSLYVVNVTKSLLGCFMSRTGL